MRTERERVKREKNRLTWYQPAWVAATAFASPAVDTCALSTFVKERWRVARFNVRRATCLCLWNLSTQDLSSFHSRTWMQLQHKSVFPHLGQVFHFLFFFLVLCATVNWDPAQAATFSVFRLSHWFKCTLGMMFTVIHWRQKHEETRGIIYSVLSSLLAVRVHFHQCLCVIHLFQVTHAEKWKMMHKLHLHPPLLLTRLLGLLLLLTRSLPGLCMLVVSCI